MERKYGDQNRDQGRDETLRPGDQIHQISTVVRPPSRREGLLYIGWTRDSRPTVVRNSSQLSPAARNSFEKYQAARLPIQEISHSEVLPLQYQFTGSVLDYPDVAGHRAEDLLTYGVKDSQGDTRTINLSEEQVLDAIVDSSHPWQDVGAIDPRDRITTTRSMYTIFVEPGDDSDEAIALLFTPPVPGMSNELRFKLFIKDTIDNLLKLDESRTSAYKKGYADALNEGGGGLDFLRIFYKASDEELASLQARKRKIMASGFRLASKLKLLKFSDEELERYSKGVALEQGDLRSLLEAAHTMRAATR